MAGGGTEYVQDTLGMVQKDASVGKLGDLTTTNLSADQASSTIEGAARLSAAGAVQGVSLPAVNAGASAQNSLSTSDTKKNVGLWIMPLYQSNNTGGMKAGEFKSGYTSDLGGVAIGVTLSSVPCVTSSNS